jgi:hypothetical protein
MANLLVWVALIGGPIAAAALNVPAWALAIATVFAFALFWQSLRQRLALESYAACVLLDDQIRERHKASLITFVGEQPGLNAVKLGNRGADAIRRLAEAMAEPKDGPSSILAAASLMVLARDEYWKRLLNQSDAPSPNA